MPAAALRTFPPTASWSTVQALEVAVGEGSKKPSLDNAMARAMSYYISRGCYDDEGGSSFAQQETKWEQQPRGSAVQVEKTRHQQFLQSSQFPQFKNRFKLRNSTTFCNARSISPRLYCQQHQERAAERERSDEGSFDERRLIQKEVDRMIEKNNKIIRALEQEAMKRIPKRERRVGGGGGGGGGGAHGMLSLSTSFREEGKMMMKTKPKQKQLLRRRTISEQLAEGLSHIDMAREKSRRKSVEVIKCRQEQSRKLLLSPKAAGWMANNTVPQLKSKKMAMMAAQAPASPASYKRSSKLPDIKRLLTYRPWYLSRF